MHASVTALTIIKDLWQKNAKKGLGIQLESCSLVFYYEEYNYNGEIIHNYLFSYLFCFGTADPC